MWVHVQCSASRIVLDAGMLGIDLTLLETPKLEQGDGPRDIGVI